MKKKVRYLIRYKKWSRIGRMPDAGLCSSLPGGVPELLTPTRYDYIILINEGVSSAFWASQTSLFNNDKKRWYGFNPLRQNIVLFLAAMNEEL